MHMWVLHVRAICHGLMPRPGIEPRTLRSKVALYHVAIKAGLYRKTVQVYDIHVPNLYPVAKPVLRHLIHDLLKPEMVKMRNCNFSRVLAWFLCFGCMIV